MPTLTDYSVGDLVVLGHDGVARIEDISSVDIDGEAATMLKLTVLSARMTVTIPLERALDRGLRAVADPATAQIALDKLATEPGMELVAGLTWDKQLKRLKERFGSGDLDGIVGVPRRSSATPRRALSTSLRISRQGRRRSSPDRAARSRPDACWSATSLPRVDRGEPDRREPIRRSVARPRSIPGKPAAAADGGVCVDIRGSGTSGTQDVPQRRVTWRSSAYAPRTTSFDARTSGGVLHVPDLPLSLLLLPQATRAIGSTPTAGRGLPPGPSTGRRRSRTAPSPDH
jgi:RNA polymerase-interacting CarD/CdnL/TRCF family regulator